MKLRLSTLLFFVTTTAFAQYDSAVLATIKSIKEDYTKLKEENGQLRTTVNELANNNKLTDSSRWKKIRTNIYSSTEAYKLLNDKIINLKSQVTNQEFQNYIKRLSSIKDNPLGFSFDKKLRESAEKSSIFTKKSTAEKFLNTIDAVTKSPLIGLIPYASDAVKISNSVINIAYSAGVHKQKIDLNKIKEFEDDLNKYLSYYISLDSANLINASSNVQIITQLEKLQQDLLQKALKDAKEIGISIRERNSNERIDPYLNYVFSVFTKSSVETIIQTKEKGKSPTQILKTEGKTISVNNNLDQFIELTERFQLIYSVYFDLEKKYYAQISKALIKAHTTGIIQAIGNKSSDTVYQELISQFTTKREEKDKLIADSIKFSELEDKVKELDTFKYI